MRLGLGILSSRDPKTLAATLKNYANNRLFDLFDEKRVFFQEINRETREIADYFGLEVDGSKADLGSMGGVRDLVEGTSADVMLLLEDDCLIVDGLTTLEDTLRRAIADIEAHDIKIFRLHARRNPGEVFDQYQQFFPVHEPFDSDTAIDQASAFKTKLNRLLRAGEANTFRASAFHIERDPVARQPGALRHSENGNVLTDSRFINWSNQSILLRPDFMRERMLPAITANAGDAPKSEMQDIEQAVNKQWWRDLRVPIGMSDPGIFKNNPA